MFYYSYCFHEVSVGIYMIKFYIVLLCLGIKQFYFYTPLFKMLQSRVLKKKDDNNCLHKT